MSNTFGVWEVEVTDQFKDWWSTLADEQQRAITNRVEVLAERGPDLGHLLIESTPRGINR